MKNAHKNQTDRASEPGKAQNPVDGLGRLLDADMRAVNALILKRMDSDVPLIPQLATYLIAAGGKRIRPLLTLAATQIYNGDMPRAHGLASCVEFIHTATLLHDDVVDESLERRGQETANLVFGNQASVLVGDFLFARAFQLMTADGSLDVLRILSNASAVIAEGEVMQLSLANNIETSLEQYLEVITAKTAALFAAACEIGPIIAGAGPEAARAMAAYGLNMGIAFQIADDALDYMAAREKLGKTVGDDFREGKMTAPVIYALQDSDAEERIFWERCMARREQSEADLQTAQALFEKYDSITRAMTLARIYGDRAAEALAGAPAGALRDCLHNLIDYTINREY
ncbi:MAG: polyprenyl synthetase family protein [Alphaproteobacteria bacterium]|nr:polyprenyl synthetase family protein [Alphaproteobacteria bacterium]